MNAQGLMLRKTAPTHADAEMLRKLRAIALLDSEANEAERDRKRTSEAEKFLHEWTVGEILAREG